MSSRSEILDDLKKFISIQSVSTDSSRFAEIKKAVSFLEEKLVSLGFSIRVVKKGKFPPLIIAIRKVPKAQETIGIYGHYDVQPEDPISEWKTKPFELTLKRDKMYGRGVADSKGHIIQNITALKSLITKKKCINNIVLILEGEEEIGSKNFIRYINQVKGLLSDIDVFYVLDMGMHEKNRPQIFYALRGLLFFELNISIGVRDLHSGVYGNLVKNPAQVLTDLLSKMKDLNTGKVKIPNFYNRVRKIDTKERKLLKEIERSSSVEEKQAQVYKLSPVDSIYPSLSTKIYPSLEINGIYSGYIGEGVKTIIPHESTVKFSFRLVEDQRLDEIEEKTAQFIKKNIPEGVKYKLATFAKAAPFHISVDNKYMKRTASCLKEIFGSDVLYNRSGVTIPAAEILYRFFNKPVIVTGFTLPDDNIHAPNENIDMEMFFAGIRALEKIYSLHSSTS